MTDAAAAREVFDRRVRAWLAADLDAYLDCWADDAVVVLPNLDAPLRGREAFGRVVRHSFAWARPVAFEVHHFALDGDVVLAEWTLRAERHDDAVVVEWHGASACAFDGQGRITWWNEYHRGPPAPRRR